MDEPFRGTTLKYEDLQLMSSDLSLAVRADLLTPL